jgi:predicted glycoside hydrolase/deacetylase ChbG (UPF0249 family)
MRVILSADDFGLDDDTVQRTISCLNDGILQGASIMAQMPATARALEYARGRVDLSFGVHLVFCTDGLERPILAQSIIPNLIRPDGAFFPSNRIRALGLLNRLPESEIEQEMKAQLAFVRDHGVRIDYVDSHGHLHKLPPFQRALRRVLPWFGITRVRRAQDVYLGSTLRRPMALAFPIFNWSISRQFQTTDKFFMPDIRGQIHWVPRLLKSMTRFEGIMEVGVHPGAKEHWRKREELEAREFANLARSDGHCFVGWSDVGSG